MLPLTLLLPPLFLVLQITAEGINLYQGYVASDGEDVCLAYLVGSRWAVCSRSLIEGMNKNKLMLRFGCDKFGIESIQFYNPPEARREKTNFELDLALLKMERRTLVEPAQISADYPAEGALVQGAGVDWEVAGYEDCARRTRLSTGAFCLRNRSSALPPGSGLFDEGVLTGVAGQEQDSYRPVTAIAPATAWIIDTMAELVPRQPSLH